jgi:hypothetical protein
MRLLYAPCLQKAPKSAKHIGITPPKSSPMLNARKFGNCSMFLTNHRTTSLLEATQNVVHLLSQPKSNTKLRHLFFLRTSPIHSFQTEQLKEDASRLFSQVLQESVGESNHRMAPIPRSTHTMPTASIPNLASVSTLHHLKRRFENQPCRAWE